VTIIAIEVERLIATLEARFDKYEKSLDRALGKTDRTFTAIEKRGKKMQASLAATFATNFGKSFLAGAAGAVGVGALSQIPGVVRKIVGEAAGLVDAAAKIGITTDALQVLHFAATQGGASIEDMDKALGFWTKTVGQAAEGGGELAKVLAANGIALRDSSGQLRAPLDLLRDYADLIKNARSEQERARLTTIAFGRSGADLANVFRNGAADIDAASAALGRMGGVISEETLKQIAAIDDQLDAVATEWELRFKKMALGAVIALDTVADGAGNPIERLQQLNSILQRFNVLMALTKIPGDLQTLFGDAPANPAPAVTSPRGAALQQIKDYRDAVEDILVSVRAIGSNPLNVSPTGDAAREVLRLDEALKAGEISLTEFETGLDKVGAAQPSFQPMIESLKSVQREIAATISKAAMLSDDRPANRRAGIAGSAERLRRNVAAGQAGLAEASKAAEMTTGEKRLEAEMARLRKAIEAEHPGALVTDAQVRARAQENLAAVDANTVIEGYVARVRKAEGDGNNPNSSAEGIGQFIESTWLDLFKRYFPDRAKGMSDAAILALRKDEASAERLIDAYARENAAVLQKAGVTVTEAALQLSHFLGAGDAAKVLTAASGTPLKGLISDASIAANPTILGGGRTVDDAIAYAQKRAGLTTTGTQRFDSNQDFEAYLKQQQASVASMREEIDLRRQLGAETIQNTKAYAEFQRAQELLADAQQAGAAVGLEVHDVNTLLHGDLSKLTPAAQAQAEKMRELAASYGLASEASAALDVGQQKVGDKLSGVNEIGRDALGTFISGLRQGKSAADALAGALDGVLDRLINIALDALFPTGGGGAAGGLGGLISALLGGLGGGVAVGANARGTNHWRGGLSVVGEKGPELVNLPRGAQVIPNDILRRAGQRGRSGSPLIGPGDVAMGGRAASSAAMAAARGRSAPSSASIMIDVRGATGNAEVQSMVAAGVRQGVEEYDRRMADGRIISQRLGKAQLRFG
jgi:hypothetical protein